MRRLRCRRRRSACAGSATATAGRDRGGAAAGRVVVARLGRARRGAARRAARGAERRATQARSSSLQAKRELAEHEPGEREQHHAASAASARRSTDWGSGRPAQSTPCAPAKPDRSAPAGGQARHRRPADQAERDAEQRPRRSRRAAAPRPARPPARARACAGRRCATTGRNSAAPMPNSSSRTVAGIGAGRAQPIGRRAAGGGRQAGIGRRCGSPAPAPARSPARPGPRPAAHEEPPHRLAQRVAPVAAPVRAWVSAPQPSPCPFPRESSAAKMPCARTPRSSELRGATPRRCAATARRRAMEQRDVIIFGGGLVGLALAAALDSSGLDAVVIDPGRSRAARRRRVRRPHQRGLVELDADVRGDRGQRALSRARAARSAGSRSPTGSTPGGLHFDRRATTKPLGWMHENRHLRAALQRAPRRASNIDLRWQATRGHGRPRRASACTVDARRRDASSRAPLLVAADGRNSPTREAAGIRARALEIRPSRDRLGASPRTAARPCRL